MIDRRSASLKAFRGQVMWNAPQGFSHTQLPGPSWEDEYQLQRTVGSGSFGQVFLVLHKED